MKPFSTHKRILIVMVGSLAWATSSAFLRSRSSRCRRSIFVRQQNFHVSETARFFSSTRTQSVVDDDDTATTSRETPPISSPSSPSPEEDIPLYICQGLLAVEKPLDWTSSNVVSFIRGILEKDAKARGANVANFRSRGNKSRKIKVGHGGTLDPLATGVLVIGVGKGTKELQQ